MSAALEQLEQQIMALPPEERARLIGKMWESLGDTTIPYVTDEWRAELERRGRELDSGRASIISGDQVMREARERIQSVRHK
jgi:putative addiction module component (TIGR02574 family)